MDGCMRAHGGAWPCASRVEHRTFAASAGALLGRTSALGGANCSFAMIQDDIENTQLSDGSIGMFTDSKSQL